MSNCVSLLVTAAVFAVAFGVTHADDFPVLTGPYLGQKPPGDEPLIFAPGVVSTEDHLEMGCTWTPDGKEFYFSRSETADGSSNWAIWVVSEKDGRWNPPVVAPFSGVYRDFAPFITPDGAFMIFYRQSSEESEVRAGTWIVERNGNSWGKPRFFTDAYCVTTADFEVFYYSTESNENTDRDIAKMTLANGILSEQQNLEGDINSKAWDAHACISTDGSLLVYDSDRPGGYDEFDIYVSFRKENGSWSNGLNLGAKINQGHRSNASFFHDGRYIALACSGDIYWVDAGIIEELRPDNLE